MANIPMDKKVLWEFLKAGAAFGGELFPTEVGISQGATLSPILGNMALDGLQSYLYVSSLRIRTVSSKPKSPNRRR